MEEMGKLFFASLREMLEQMAGIELKMDTAEGKSNADIKSLGLSSIITFAGKIKGRLLIDMEPKLGLEIARNVYGQDFDDVRDPLVLASISELNNIVSGDAITVLNDKHALSLRLAPPVVFTGKDVSISIPKVSSQTVDCISASGKLKINIAFEGGVK